MHIMRKRPIIHHFQLFSSTSLRHNTLSLFRSLSSGQHPLNSALVLFLAFPVILVLSFSPTFLCIALYTVSTVCLLYSPRHLTFTVYSSYIPGMCPAKYLSGLHAEMGLVDVLCSDACRNSHGTSREVTRRVIIK